MITLLHNGTPVTINSYGVGLYVNPAESTLKADWRVGKVLDLQGLFIDSNNALTSNWQADVVYSVGSGLSVVNNQLGLVNNSPDWQGGKVAGLSAGLSIDSNKILTSNWQTNLVNSVGSGLTIVNGQFGLAPPLIVQHPANADGTTVSALICTGFYGMGNGGPVHLCPEGYDNGNALAGLPDKTADAVNATIVIYDMDAGASGTYTLSGGSMVRTVGASTTTWCSGPTTPVFQEAGMTTGFTPGWTVSIGANTTYGGYNVAVQPPQSLNHTFVALVRLDIVRITQG